ncbi:unnamed protein product [Linum tenue]|uniref:Amino acid transporter transmembrane domain-containing protein n=1 Tax=Linum tenue TaxID=586396 RepID=A0AAV0MMM4_9ROSI|nr:unnamed protein product [Linum tenue]
MARDMEVEKVLQLIPPAQSEATTAAAAAATSPAADQAMLISKGTTFIRTCFNAINSISGVGILSMPFALSQGGCLSLALLFLVAILSLYTGLLVQRCMEGDLLVKTYPDIGERAFGAKGRVTVSIYLYLTLYLLAVEFLILEGDNLNKLFRTSLGVLAYVSIGGVVASFALAGCVSWVGAVDGVGFGESAGRLLRLGTLPNAVGLFTFGFSAHSVFPTLCNSMRDRTQFSKVLLIGFLVTSLTYGWTAVVGYLMYGDHTKSPITLNLPVGRISSKIAIYTTLVNPVTKYAIVITPIANAIEERYIFSTNYSQLLSILMRTLILVSTVVVALTVPFFGYIMAFMGSTLSVMGTMLLPCLCYIRIKELGRRLGLEFIVIVGILIFGVVVGVVGTYTSVRQIAKHL